MYINRSTNYLTILASDRLYSVCNRNVLCRLLFTITSFVFFLILFVKFNCVCQLEMNDNWLRRCIQLYRWDDSLLLIMRQVKAEIVHLSYSFLKLSDLCWRLFVSLILQLTTSVLYKLNSISCHFGAWSSPISIEATNRHFLAPKSCHSPQLVACAIVGNNLITFVPVLAHTSLTFQMSETVK